jgi:flagellar biogenesis protein FliO
MPSLAPLIALILTAASPIGLAAQEPSPVEPVVSWNAADPPVDMGAQRASATSQASSGLGDCPDFHHTKMGLSPSELPDGRCLANGVSPPPAPTGAIPLAPPRHKASLPISAAGHAAQQERHGPTMITAASSLAIVLGLFFLLAWGMRYLAPRGPTLLPGEVFEVLGHAPLAGRQHVHLLRCGGKLLLVSLTTSGAETLTEVTDPGEVQRLANLCSQDGRTARGGRREARHG